MEEKNRTKNSIKNVKTGLIVQIINKVMAFVVRTIFIKYLNSEYIGINGLFSNILSILSFAELGIGTAIIYNMYKPIAEDDKEKIKSLMKIYKKSYNIIGIIIFLLGLMIIPFFKYIITDVSNIKENIILIYLLFLIETASSYFFTYKKSIIIAHQKQSIINNFNSVFYLIKSIIQIIVLVYTQNYITYLVIGIASTIIENILLSRKADKLYPYLQEKGVKELELKEKSTIFNNVKSLAIYQFGSVIMNGTDNILISALINVKTVGLISNYTLIISSVKNILTSSLNGITASVGNLNAIETKEKKESILNELVFIYFIIYSFCTISFIILLNPFINIWLGNDFVLNFNISIALAISFFIEGLRSPGFIYRTTLGLFAKSKATPYIGAISNIILSIIFCKLWGLVGIFIATIVAQLISYFWIDPFLIYKYEFKTSVKKYYKKMVIYLVAFIFELLLTLFVINGINNVDMTSLLIKIMIVLIVPNICNILFFYKSSEYNFLKNKFIIPFCLKLKKK